jgi:hypothetical protein
MSALKDELLARRATQPQSISCVAGPARPPALMIRPWGGETLVLPWSRFESARFVGAETDGQVVLSFTGHRVTITGENLHGLLDDIAEFRVDCLRELPPQYRASAGAGAPFIAGIQIRELADANRLTQG